MKHKSSIQVRFKDIDALGHVNNANHLTYFELARISYFEDVIGEEIDWNRDGMILARITIDYKQPILLHDKVFVYTWMIKTGTTSFELEYKIIKEEKDGSETTLSIGTSVIVCYNYAEKKSIKIPESWIEKMKKEI